MITTESIEYAIRDAMKINIMSQIETGSPLLDAMIRVFILSFITGFMGKVLYYITDTTSIGFSIRTMFHSLYFFWKRPKKIVIAGCRYNQHNFLNSRFEFSLRFRAVLSKIIQSMELRKKNTKLIQQLRELQVRDGVSYYDDCKPENKNEFNFIVDQLNYFELEDNIFCNIKINLSNVKNKETKNKIQKEEYTIELWSPDMTCNELMKYVEKTTDAFEKTQKEENDKKRFIFKFEGRDEEKYVRWQVTEFRSKRTLEQVFFENKAEVMDFLERFVSERELYERIGKPWQLGILLEGEPGCGKTSFIIGLANYLGRSIKDCQFNRMKTIDDLEQCIQCVRYDNKDMSMDNVIMVAEDFDCMTNIAKSRKLLEKEKLDAKEREERRRNDLKEQMSSIKNDEAKAIMCAIGQQLECEMPPQSSIMSGPRPIDNNKTRDITLSNLLNILDGINTLPGRIIIFSTNCPETLDEAFLRPGRIDLRIRFGRPSRRVVGEIMGHWYRCIDSFYGKKLYATFQKKWRTYEKQIVDGKLRPCDITNLLQKYGEDIDGVFRELIQ